MLRIINLNAGYEKNKILNDISLKVKPNEIVALFGHNGSGKSTLLKSIFHLTDIYSGKILFDNLDITKKRTSDLINYGISFAPQGRQIFRNLTVEENLQIFVNDSQEINKMYEIFPFLEEKKKFLAQTLSGGQKQLLGICRLLVQKPKLMILDEPSLGLDPKSSRIVFKKIKNIKGGNMSILMAEQNIKRAIEIADRFYFLNNGRIVYEGKKKLPLNIWKLDE